MELLRLNKNVFVLWKQFKHTYKKHAWGSFHVLNFKHNYMIQCMFWNI
jgi:hypothetical protein